MRRMGRKRNKPDGLPARVYFKHGQYWFVDRAMKWHRLGPDKVEALKRHAELLGEQRKTFAQIVEKYRNLVLIKKAPRTQIDNEKELVNLLKVFATAPICAIRRGHVAAYRDARGAPVRANRELALLSHIFTKAIEWEDAKENPVLNVERNTEVPRDRYITDAEFLAIYNPAPLMIQVMMGLALLTGQRESDLLKIRKAVDLVDEGIAFKQGKTKKKLIVRWSDPLSFVANQALGLTKQGVSSIFLVCQPNGQPYTAGGFRGAWGEHMRDCMKKGLLAERFTFHDIRAKAGSDVDADSRLLGHMDKRTFHRVYRRKGELVDPVR